MLNATDGPAEGVNSRIQAVKVPIPSGSMSSPTHQAKSQIHKTQRTGRGWSTCLALRSNQLPLFSSLGLVVVIGGFGRLVCIHNSLCICKRIDSPFISRDDH